MNSSFLLPSSAPIPSFRSRDDVAVGSPISINHPTSGGDQQPAARPFPFQLPMMHSDLHVDLKLPVWGSQSSASASSLQDTRSESPQRRCGRRCAPPQIRGCFYMLPLLAIGIFLSSTSEAFLSHSVVKPPSLVKQPSAPFYSPSTSQMRLSLSNTSSSSATAVSTSPPSSSLDVGEPQQDPLGLTKELRKLTNAFESIGDDKLRYKQLLYMAGQLAPMDDALKTPINKVPGCLSTVHVHATLDKSTQPPTITYVGDSDGLLTKGLVALLVRGLSGNTAQQIQTVDPTFIQQAGISASLTPGRNNGFLNMLAVMKRQALQLEEQEEVVEAAASAATSIGGTATSKSSSSSSGRPRYDAMMEALQRELQPAVLELVDKSHEHAGHAGNDKDGESHFDLYVVSNSFQGLNLVKRHKLVYQVLSDSMPHIHALQIRAQTPSEAGL